MVSSALDEETQKMALRMAIERRKAIDAIAKENKLAISDILDEGKNIIRAKAQEEQLPGTPQIDYLDGLIEHIYNMTITPDDNIQETPASDASTKGANSINWMDLEILPSLRTEQNSRN